MLSLKLNKIIPISIFTALSLSSLNAGSCDNRVFNLKINEQVTVQEILTQLSDMCHFSIVSKDQFAKDAIGEQIFGVNIKDKTLNEIFALLLSEKDMSYTFSQDVLKISSLQTKTFKLDYITSVREGTSITKASVDSGPVEASGSQDGDEEKLKDNSIKTTEKFDFWDKLDTEIKAILNNTTENIVAPDPVINANAGLVTVTGTAAQLRRVSEYIKDIQERLKKQVVIDVSIISVELANSYTKGVDWSKFNLGFKTGLYGGPRVTNFKENGSPVYSYVPATELFWSSRGNGLGSGFSQNMNLVAGFNFNLDGVLNFLETNGRTKVVSSPKITTLNNQQALISVGDNINYRVQEQSTNNNSLSGRTEVTYKQYSIFIGILLNLLPEISDDNKIMLRINPSLSSFKYTEDDTRQSTTIREIAPDTVQKKLSTVVQVNSGDTIVLGGLIAQAKGKENSKVPFLGDIPVLGNAFKSTKDNLKTTELVFIITPRIVDISNPTPINQSLKDLGFSRSIYER